MGRTLRPSGTVRPLVSWLIVGALYGAITLAMATPFLDYREIGRASFAGDGRLIVWTMAWIARVLTEGYALFAAPMFFPAATPLAYTEHMLVLGILGTPIQLVTGNPVLAFNIVWLASFWANAMAAHALAFHLTRRHDAALVAGLTYGWSYFRVLHLAHLQLQWSAWLPLGVLLLHRWFLQPTLPRLGAAMLVSAAQMLTSWYMAVLTLILHGAWTIWLMMGRGRREWIRHLWALAAAAIAGAALLLPLVVPYLRVIRPTPQADVHGDSVGLLDYVAPPETTWAGVTLAAQSAYQGGQVWGEQTVFLGFIPLAFAILGLGRWRGTPEGDDARARTFFVLIAIVALALSLGPMGGFGPYDLLTRVPGLALFRAPARFALLVLLAVAMLAAFGSAAVWTALERKKGARLRRGLVAVVSLAMLFEWWPMTGTIPKAETRPVPIIYRAFEHLPPGAIVSLPDYATRPEWYVRADYLLYAAVHRRPIVNGYGRSDPPEYASIIEQLSTFPSSTSAELARALRVRYFVIHSEEMEGAAIIDRASRTVAFRLVTRAGGDAIFEVVEDNR